MRGTRVASSTLALIGMLAGAAGCAGNKSNVKQTNAAPGYGGQSAMAGTTAPSAHLGEQPAVPGSVSIQTNKQVVQSERVRIPTIEQRSLRADINRMTAKDFIALGLTPNAAQNAVHYRQQIGKFQSVHELKNVPGMDVAWVDRMENRLGTELG